MITAAKKNAPESKLRGAERRAYPRYPSDLETSCQPLGGSASWPARVRDVSTGGIGLVMTRHFKPGTLLTMELENEEHTVNRSLLARVVHARQQADGLWLIGCAFSSELDDDDLRAFCIERVQPEASECRAWVRFSCDMPTSCRAADDDNAPSFPVRILNVAPGGIGLQTTHPFADGAFVNLDVPDDRGRTRTLLIRIIHREKTANGWFLGCEFAQHLSDAELRGLTG